MSIVANLDKSQVSAPLAEIFDRAEHHFGHVPNLIRALAPNPALCTSISNFLIQSLDKGRIDWGFKELIILKTLRGMKSFYSYGAHEKLAYDLGVPSEKIGDIANSLWKTSQHFSKAEKTVFALIDQIVEDANDVSDELWDRLRKDWDNGQLLEINSVITTFLMIGRVGDTLGVSDPILFSRAVI